MVSQTGVITVRDAEEKDLAQLANLIHFEVYVHRHLDWRPPLEWIGSQPFLVAEQDGDIVATLSCPPDPAHVAWIRLFAVAYDLPLKNAWQNLWPQAHAKLSHLDGLDWFAAIPLRPWFKSLLEESHFVNTHSVVVLSWDGGGLPLETHQQGLVIRSMDLDDLAIVRQVDYAAFVPLWQNSLDSLELAFRQAVVATVAEIDGQIVGYQISTGTPAGGHLARLAVLPDLQRNGIGSRLLRDLLLEFKERGAARVTVNTQQDNLASLALYRKAGFHRTGEEYPIYQLPAHS